MKRLCWIVVLLFGASGAFAETCNFDDLWACSNPWYVQAGTGGIAIYYQDLFGMACVRHDGCYRHGHATYGLSRTQCDDMFYEDMKDKCPDVTSWTSAATLGATVAACQGVALTYYQAVKNFGGPHYHDNNSTICHYDRKNENAHVHAVLDDGTFSAAAHRYMWTKGWWIASTYPSNAGERLLLLKPGNGSMHIHSPQATGAVGARVDDQNWDSGWTNARQYSVGGSNYVFFLKSSDGKAMIRKVNLDGSLGGTVKTYDWSNGWTISEIYDVGGKTYLLLVKGMSLQNHYLMGSLGLVPPGGSGLARIYQMKSDGTVGSLVKEYAWSSGWSIAKAYEVKNKKYLLLLKTATGKVHQYPLNTSDGTLGALLEKHDWSGDWTTAEFFENAGKTYLFLLKSKDGSAKVYQVSDDGKIGPVVKEYDWSKGWTSASFYHADGQLYSFLIKAVEDGL